MGPITSEVGEVYDQVGLVITRGLRGAIAA